MSTRLVSMFRPDYMKQIEDHITFVLAGTAFITSDFLDIADLPATNKALSGPMEKGKIHRIPMRS